MSKLSNTLLMLSYLQNGRKYSINELAERLEVTPRMVRLYKEDLEKSGFMIDTIYGPYGGYVLRKSSIPMEVRFNDYDIEMLNEILKCKLSNSEKTFIKGLLDRIKIYNSENDLPLFTDNVQKIYNSISRAIKEKRKVKITYDSLDKGLNDRIIHPLEIFSYSDNFGVAAFCEKKKDLRHFEFKRIKKIEILEENY